MTVSKKVVMPETKDNNDVVMGDLEEFKINKIPKNKARRSIIRISTYSYGTKGLQWHYFSNSTKKK